MPDKDENIKTADAALPMCPMLTAAYHEITYCVKAACAWWPEWGSKCAIPAIVEAIGDVEMNIIQNISTEP